MNESGHPPQVHQRPETRSQAQLAPADPGRVPDDVSDGDELSVLDLINLILRRRRLVVILPLITTLLAAILLLIIPPTFAASTAFVPEMATASGIPSGIASLAGQFGIALPTEAGQTAQFYAQVLRSEGILNRVLLSRFPDPRSPAGDSIILLAALGVEGDSLADSLHNGREKLAERLSVHVDQRTNIVTVRTESRYPALAAGMANRFIEYLHEFNTHTRQSHARERRRFVEQRVEDAEASLRAAEEAVKNFYASNRTWQQSPQLVYEHDRLQRQVQIRQEVFLTLRREYETARITEANDTPVITVLHAAGIPQERAKPRRKLLVAVVLVLAVALSIVAAVLSELAARARRRGSHEYLEFRQLVASIRRDIRNIFSGAFPSRR